LRHLSSVDSIVREVAAESFGASIRPLGQLAGGYILASDEEGLLLIDQRAAHERILFDRYRAQEAARSAESQHLLMPETFDLTPAQAAVFDQVVGELESYGFGMMRLSGRTVAIRSVPADLPAGEARSMLSEILNTLDAGRRTEARAVLREQIALALASRAAIKLRVTLAREKMSWLIESLLKTSSPTTCPHGGPTVLRLSARDIEKNFHHS
jgi:DNA mismatch repair protein MutL